MRDCLEVVAFLFCYQFAVAFEIRTKEFVSSNLDCCTIKSISGKRKI